jgi:hypothetical protein
MTLDEAITVLKNAVKWSEVKNQKHIDLTLIPAEERTLYQRALAVTTIEVEKGTLTQDALKSRLGLE